MKFTEGLLWKEELKDFELLAKTAPLGNAEAYGHSLEEPEGDSYDLIDKLDGMMVLSLEFGQRCRVQSHARRWLQLVGCATLLMVASNFGGSDGVGESRVELRRSLRQTRVS